MFRGSVHYHHGREHGSIQAGIVLEESRVLHLVLKANRRGLIASAARKKLLKPMLTMTHLLLQGNTYSKETTPQIVPLTSTNILKNYKC